MVMKWCLWILVASCWPLHGFHIAHRSVTKLAEGGGMAMSTQHSSDQQYPHSDHTRYRKELLRFSSPLPILTAAVITGGMLLARPYSAQAYDDEDIEIYVDKKNGFRVGLWPGCKQKRTISPTRYKDTDPYEVVYVASNLAEGCSLLVNNIDARALLRDAGIEWWFGDLDTLKELGTPTLLADLLIKQRKAKLLTDSNPYEGPKSEEEKRFNDYQGGMDEGYKIVDSSFDDEEQSVQFTYTNSIGKYINEVGYVKGFYSKEKLKLVWISALGSVFESDYGDVLKDVRSSFQPLH